MSGEPKIRLDILTAMGDVVEEKRVIENSTVALPDAWLTWYLDANQMVIDERTGEIVQTVSIRDNRPVRVFKDLPAVTPQDINELASEKWDEAQARIDYYKRKNSMLLWFAIIAVMILLIISLVVLFKL